MKENGFLHFHGVHVLPACILSFINEVLCNSNATDIPRYMYQF
jgi:hypothetical protein